MTRKLQAFIHDVVEIKCFIMNILMKQTFFLVTTIDIGAKHLVYQSSR